MDAINTNFVTKARQLVVGQAELMDIIATAGDPMTQAQREHLQKAAGYMRDAEYRLGLVLGPKYLPSTPEAMVHAAAGARCSCPADESETCWRCVAQHILSLAGTAP